MADTSQATYEPVEKLPNPPKHLGKIAAEARSRVKAVTVPKLDEKAAKYFGDPLGVRRR